jgi:hypothetical protein
MFFLVSTCPARCPSVAQCLRHCESASEPTDRPGFQLRWANCRCRRHRPTVARASRRCPSLHHACPPGALSRHVARTSATAKRQKARGNQTIAKNSPQRPSICMWNSGQDMPARMCGVSNTSLHVLTPPTQNFHTVFTHRSTNLNTPRLSFLTSPLGGLPKAVMGSTNSARKQKGQLLDLCERRRGSEPARSVRP